MLAVGSSASTSACISVFVSFCISSCQPWLCCRLPFILANPMLTTPKPETHVVGKKTSYRMTTSKLGLFYRKLCRGIWILRSLRRSSTGEKGGKAGQDCSIPSRLFGRQSYRGAILRTAGFVRSRVVMLLSHDPMMITRWCGAAGGDGMAGRSMTQTGKGNDNSMA